MHDVEAIYTWHMITANSIWKSFLKSEQIAVSQASFVFQKRFPDAVSS